MIVRAVFFDWVNTLVHMEPDRHVLSAEVCREFGIDVSPRDILRGIYAAEEEMPAGRPLRWAADDDPEMYLRYNDRVLTEAGVTPPNRTTAAAMLQQFAERFREIRFVAFDDVRPALESLRSRGITIGLISNMPHPMQPMLQKLKLDDLLDFAVTPLDVEGRGKPAAPIFLEALRRAGATAEEAIHVGDEHFVDGKGARATGITPVILDRHDLFPSLQGYHRITTLAQLSDVLDGLA